MGLFDTLDVNGLMNCPTCDTPVDDLQTKALGCMMRYFYYGDIVSNDNSCIIAHGYCNVCKNFLYSDILFDTDGRWIGYSKPRTKK